MDRFSNILLNWYDDKHRELPWRKTKNPYFIWLSEILLQQTRVEQGLGYYLKFIEEFPNIFDLASAAEEEVLKLWQGLGYYSRARNLHFTAKHIVNNLNGEFPNTYQELLKLKGVGPYTAAAISSICFNERVAVVDGNVYRFLSRYFGISSPIDSNEGKKEFQELANSLISVKRPGDFNQAMMEMGAQICSPKKWQCAQCAFAFSCQALEKGIIHDLPRKVNKVKVKNRNIHYIVCESEGELLYRKRVEKDIWQGLYDFPEEQDGVEDLLGKENYKLLNMPVHMQHILSHQKLSIRFSHFEIKNRKKISLDGTWASKKGDSTLPLPRIIEKYLLEKIT